MSKITTLPVATALDGSETIPLVQLGATRRMSVGTLSAQVAVTAQPYVDKANHYANDNIDADVPGGAPGERGARWWSNVAKGIANTISAQVAAAIQPYVDKANHYANDNTNTDIVGGAAGERGARWWASVAQSVAAALPGQVTSNIQPYVDKASHYANDNTDSDVPGGMAGERGARWWAGVAQGVATALASVFTGDPPDRDRVYVADATGAKPWAVEKDGSFLAGFLKSPRALLRWVRSGRLSVIDGLDNIVLDIAATVSIYLHYLVDGSGRIARSVAPDGAFLADMIRSARASIRMLDVGLITFRNGLGNALSETSATLAVFFRYVADGGGRIAHAVAPDGAFLADMIRSARASVRTLETGAVLLKDGLGTLAGTISLSGFTNNLRSIVDAGGTMATVQRTDGLIDQPLPQATLWAGGRMGGGPGYLLDTRRRPSGLHDVYAIVNKPGDASHGTETKLSSDPAGDYLDPQAFGNFCICVKRVGGRLSKVALALTGGGVELPHRANSSIVVNADSFGSDQLLANIRAAIPNAVGGVLFGSGGSWLSAHLARMFGGTVPAGEAGNYQVSGGGTAQAKVLGSINNGTAGVSGTLLTVTSLIDGSPVQVGQQVTLTTGALAAASTPPSIQPFGTGGTTGTGGAGTYVLSSAGNVPAGSAINIGPWSYPGLPQHQAWTHVLMDGDRNDDVLTVTGANGYFAGNVFTAAAGAQSGAFAVGQWLMGAGIAPGTKIVALGTGTGGAGTYLVNTPQTLGSAGAPVAAIYAADPLVATANSLTRILAYKAKVAAACALSHFVYVQPGIYNTLRPDEVAFKLAKDAVIAAAIPENYCETYAYMRAHGTGSTVGPNGGEVWAADNYGDVLHPSPSPGFGILNLATCVALFLISKGWI